MSWWLVIMFWNPAVSDYVVVNGWAPLEMGIYTVCDAGRDMAKLYVPDYTPAPKVGCAYADSSENAVKQYREYGL